MGQINAALVKELRDKLQLPMMDCKKALQEADGDLEKAEDILRKSGGVYSSWGLAEEYGFTDQDGSVPNWGKYFASISTQ